MELADFGESLSRESATLIKRSSGVITTRRFEQLPPEASETFTLATGASISKFPIIISGRYSESMLIRSDQDVTVELNDARDYKSQEYAQRTFTCYASSPLTIDVRVWKITFTNASGTTANIRYIGNNEITKVKTV